MLRTSKLTSRGLASTLHSANCDHCSVRDKPGPYLEKTARKGLSAAKKQWKHRAKAVSQPRKAVEKHGNGGVSTTKAVKIYIKSSVSAAKRQWKRTAKAVETHSEGGPTRICRRRPRADRYDSIPFSAPPNPSGPPQRTQLYPCLVCRSSAAGRGGRHAPFPKCRPHHRRRSRLAVDETVILLPPPPPPTPPP